MAAERPELEFVWKKRDMRAHRSMFLIDQNVLELIFGFMDCKESAIIARVNKRFSLTHQITWGRLMRVHADEAHVSLFMVKRWTKAVSPSCISIAKYRQYLVMNMTMKHVIASEPAAIGYDESLHIAFSTWR